VGFIDHLETSLLIKDKFLPLSANAKSVTFEADIKDLDADIGFLNTVTRKVILLLSLEREVLFPAGLVIGLCRRLAHLGHLVELKIASLT
jgi:hypothetical protein